MVRLVRPQAWTERAVARLRRLPRPIGLALLIAPMTAALGVTAMRASDMMAAIAAAWTPARFVAALVACVAIGLVHEASHGLAAAWAGARIVSAGVAVYYFRPGLFCEIRGLESLARERRLVVSSAGLASDLFFTSLAVLVWQLVPAAAIAEAALLTAMLLAIRVALNLNPLLKLDGYYILVDLIGRRDLRESAFAALAESVSSWRAIVSRAPRRPLAPLRRGAMVYGVLAIAYVALLAVLGIVALDRWLAARSLDAPAILAMLMVFALASLTDRMVWGRPRKRTT
jgi:putative peptide zinc metalloprotease protein